MSAMPIQARAVRLGAVPSLRQQAARAPRTSRLAPSPRLRTLVLASKKSDAADAKAAAAAAAATPPPAPVPAYTPPTDTSIYALPLGGEETPIAPVAPMYPPQYYQGMQYQGYPGYYPPPPPPPQKEGLPPFVWVGIGVAVAVGAGKLLDTAKSKQGDIQQAMMQQMLKSMMKGGAPPPGGANPFGAAGANPFGAAGANPFGGAGANPFGGAPPGFGARGGAPAGAAARAPAVDVTAKPVAEPAQAAAPKGIFSVEMLERMMKDPNMQKMIYPYLPEGMRSPETFEWMMKNPAYRQQLEQMLTAGGAGMDARMADMLKDFDMNSPEVQQQFDQMGMKPEDMIGKIMANPELTMAFQNPKVQAAIMDCSQNPMNITKYQDDKEVMDVFQKISELFPAGPGGPGGMGMPPGMGGFPPAGR